MKDYHSQSSFGPVFVGIDRENNSSQMALGISIIDAEENWKYTLIIFNFYFIELNSKIFMHNFQFYIFSINLLKYEESIEVY